MTDRPILLEFPASSAYLALARAATSGVCARLGYPVDRLDDMALAVSEATSLLLKDAAPGSKVSLRLTPSREGRLLGVAVDISVHSSSGRPPRPTSWSWTVLASLANNVSADIVDDIVTLHLQSRQEAVQQ